MQCPCSIELEFENPCEEFELVIEDGSGGGSLPYYKGPYNVIPKIDEQTLLTAEKSLSKNIVVESIPYSETTNPEGGTTVNIAFIR